MPCFLRYFEHTYIDHAAPGKGSVFHHPDTWAMYSVLQDNIDDVRGGLFLL